MSKFLTQQPKAIFMQYNFIKPIVKNLNAIKSIKKEAEKSPRKRSLEMLHTSHSCTLHSMINVLKRGSYVAVHKHSLKNFKSEQVDKGESFIAIEGEGKIIAFDDNGDIQEIIKLDAAEKTMVWIPANCWHTVVATSDYLVVFENKTGPWKEGEDKRFHPLFPKEDDPKSENVLRIWENC